jgi:hypothetical protein
MIDKTMCEVLWRYISDFYVNLRVEMGKHPQVILAMYVLSWTRLKMSTHTPHFVNPNWSHLVSSDLKLSKHNIYWTVKFTKKNHPLPLPPLSLFSCLNQWSTIFQNQTNCLSSRNMIDKTMCEVLWRYISDFYVNLRVEMGKHPQVILAMYVLSWTRIMSVLIGWPI